MGIPYVAGESKEENHIMYAVAQEHAHGYCKNTNVLSFSCKASVSPRIGATYRAEMLSALT